MLCPTTRRHMHVIIALLLLFLTELLSLVLVGGVLYILWGWVITFINLFLLFFSVSSTCRKEQVREYYTENDCRSRQPLKYAKCVGGCGNQCCAPKVVRRRKVRMVCSNNAKYIKNLDIVRKCGCTKKCY